MNGTKPQALVVLDDRVDRAVVETLVTADARLGVQEFVELRSHSPQEDGAGDVVLVACAEFTREVDEYVRTATRLHPARPLLLVCTRAPNGHLGDVMAAGAVTPAFLKEVYSLLRQMHDFVIVDTPPSFTSHVIGAVDASSDVCLVAALDSLSLKNSKLGLETLARMSYPGSLRVLLNRADSNVGIASSDVVAILGREPDVLVPSDRNVTRAVNQGEPMVSLHRGSDAARAYRELAARYLTDGQGETAVKKSRRPRLLARARS